MLVMRHPCRCDDDDGDEFDQYGDPAPGPYGCICTYNPYNCPYWDGYDPTGDNYSGRESFVRFTTTANTW